MESIDTAMVERCLSARQSFQSATSFRAVMALLCAGWIAFAGRPATAATFTEHFDNATSATSNGWTGSGNTTGGNSFGFQPGNNTGLGTAAGEAGGVLARSTNVSFYGDATLGGNFSLNDTLHADGELAITGQSAYSHAVRLGFFNTNDAGKPKITGFLGVTIAEPSTNTWYRVRPTFYFTNGTYLEPGSSSALALTNGNSIYRWRFDYTPTGGSYNQGRLTVEMFNSAGVSLGSRYQDLNSTHRGTGAGFNAFGLSVGGLGSPNASSTIHLYTDEVTYTTRANQSPTAGNTAASTLEGQTLIIPAATILAQASDPDGDPLVLLSVTSPSTNGRPVTFTSTNTVLYTPAANYIGWDCFSCIISDGHGGSATGGVIVTVYAGASSNRLSLTASNGRPALAYAGAPNNTYAIQRTPTFSPTAWTNIGVASADALGRFTFIDSNPPSPSAFYRATLPPGPVYTNWILEGYVRTNIYRSPEPTNYTSWVGIWIMPDESLMVMCHQATNPIPGQFLPHWTNYNYSGLQLANVYLRSTNGGTNWTKTAEDLFVSFSDRPNWGGSHCALNNGAILRAVDGSQLSSNDVPRRIYFQRSLDLGQTWGLPEIPPQPSRPSEFSDYIGDFADYIGRVRRLSDGRLLATGVYRTNPAPATRLMGGPVLMFSEDDGASWVPQTFVLNDIQTTNRTWNEWDCAELPNGDLFGMFRRHAPTNLSVQVRYQGRWHKSGSSWTLEDYRQSPLPHSGHPELLVTREGPILYFADNGSYWTDDVGATWHPLKINGSTSYTSRYYPRSVQARDGTIYVASHVGADDYYGRRDQAVVVDRFRLRGQ